MLAILVVVGGIVSRALGRALHWAVIAKAARSLDIIVQAGLRRGQEKPAPPNFFRRFLVCSVWGRLVLASLRIGAPHVMMKKQVFCVVSEHAARSFPYSQERSAFSNFRFDFCDSCDFVIEITIGMCVCFDLDIPARVRSVLMSIACDECGFL